MCLRLVRSGDERVSSRAIENLKKICEENWPGRTSWRSSIFTSNRSWPGEQIIAAPTLIKKLPLPLRRFIGDMSQTEKILVGLDLRPKK